MTTSIKTLFRVFMVLMIMMFGTVMFSSQVANASTYPPVSFNTYGGCVGPGSQDGVVHIIVGNLTANVGYNGTFTLWSKDQTDTEPWGGGGLPEDFSIFNHIPEGVYQVSGNVTDTGGDNFILPMTSVNVPNCSVAPGPYVGIATSDGLSGQGYWTVTNNGYTVPLGQASDWGDLYGPT